MPRFLRVSATAALVVCLASTSMAQLAPAIAPERLADGVRWLVLIDDLHLDFRRTGYIRKAVAAVVRPLFDAGVLAAIRADGSSPLALATHDTTPWSAVSDAIKGITGHALRSSDIVHILDARRGRLEPVDRAQQCAAAVEALLAEVGDRPAVLLLISNGYRTDVPAVSAHVTEIAALAGRALVPVVALDARLFAADADLRAGVPVIAEQHHQQVTATSLQLLARDTGGTIWEEGDTLSTVLTRLSRRAR